MRAMRCRHYRRNLIAWATLSLLTYSAAAWSQTYGWSEINDFTKPFFGGATLTVLAMAVAGTLIGFAYSKPLERRVSLFVLAPANTIMSAWLLVLLQEAGYLKVSMLALPPLAGVTAAAGVVVIPILFHRLPEFAAAAVDAFRAMVGRIFNRPGGTP